MCLEPPNQNCNSKLIIHFKIKQLNEEIILYDEDSVLIVKVKHQQSLLGCVVLVEHMLPNTGGPAPVLNQFIKLEMLTFSIFISYVFLLFQRKPDRNADQRSDTEFCRDKSLFN